MGGGHKSQKPKAGPPRRNRAFPRLEVLEDRRVPASFTVTDLGDNGGVNPAPGANTGTLRQAIVDANASADASSTIGFKARLTGTINLQKELDGLLKNITINGPGAITVAPATGVNVAWVFLIFPSATCEINSLVIENPSPAKGPGVNNGGALTLNDCTITSCTEGGILNLGGTLDMYNCQVTSNTARGGDGGGIANNTGGTLYCDNCTISSNSADFGGGIYTDSTGTVTLTDCSVISNSASFDGGGICSVNGTVVVNGPMGPHPLISNDLSGNTAGNAGGGLYQTGSRASATFTGAAITDNQVTGSGGKGGGVCIDGGGVEFGDYCLLDNNAATLGTAIAYRNPGGGFSIADSCTVNGTIEYYQ